MSSWLVVQTNHIDKREGPAMAIGRKTARPSAKFRQALSELGRDFCLEAFCSDDLSGVARRVLQETGKLAQRESPLQPLFVFWFVVCLTIFRADSMSAVFMRLILALRGRVKLLPLKPVHDSALCHGRKRLGVGPFRRFFRRIAGSNHRQSTFYGYRLRVIDGTFLNMPDTPENTKVFGKHRAGSRTATFPQLLVVALLDPITHELVAAKIAKKNGSEHRAARRFIASAVFAGDLLLLDRAFCGVPILAQIRERGAHFVTRAPAHHKLKPISDASAGDYDARMVGRWPRHTGKSVDVRVIEYQMPGFRPVRLVTSLRDRSIPKRELIALFHQRWDAELAFDEIKTTQLSPLQGTLRTDLRSKTPAGILQETYALLACYTLIRRKMSEAAEAVGRDGNEISFTTALRLIARATTEMLAARPLDLVALHDQLLQDLAASLIDRPRRRRRCPRAVRFQGNRYPRKGYGNSALPPFEPASEHAP